MFSGRPEAGLLTPADQVTVTRAFTAIEREAGLRQSQDDVFLLPVPPGELSYEIEDLVFRATQTGDLVPLEKIVDEREQESARRGMERRVELEDFGMYRGLRVARLAVDHRRSFSFNSKSYELARYTIRVLYPELKETDTVGDGAFDEGALYREVLDKMLLVPSVVKFFVQPLGESPFEGPSEWQPRAELSPGFPWLKVPVEDDGLYAIDGLWMAEAGLDMNAVRPEDLYIVHDGEIVPVELAGPSGEGFSAGRRLLFFARGSDSSETREAMYYLGVRPEGVIPPAFRLGPEYDQNLPALREYNRRLVAEEDNERRTDFGAFLSIQSMSWVWGQLSKAEPLGVEFDLPGLALAETDYPTTLTATLYRQAQGVHPKLDLVARIDEDEVGRMPLQGSQMAYDFSVPTHRLNPRGNQLSLVLEKSKGGSNGPEPELFLDTMEAVYTSLFTLEDGILLADFTDANSVPRGRFRIPVAGRRSGQLMVLDITDPANPVKLAVGRQGMATEVVADVALDSRILFTEAGRVGRAPAPRPSQWADWSSRNMGAEILVIYHPLFEEAAGLLSETLEGAGYTTKTVNVIALYENFSSGELSTEAIRRFLAFALHEWEGSRPQAAILIGDSTSDGRNISGEDVPNYMPIPVFVPRVGQESRSFSSDSIYSWLTGEDQAADLIIGRVSSSAPEEALAWVHNNIAYRQVNGDPTAWSGRMLAVSDTGMFQESLESVSLRSLGSGAVYTMLGADEFAWEDNYYLPQHLITRVEDSKVSPLLTAAIEEELNAGAAIVTFFGHGAPNLWSNQRFWFGGGTPNSDILRLKNGPALPLVTSFTCNNAVVDYPLRPWNICIAEDFMRHEGKGAIGAFMPSGPGYLSNHEIMAEGMLRAWARAGVRRMGPLTEVARLYQHSKTPDDEHAWMFLFLGDPTLELPPLAQGKNEPLYDKDVAESGGDLLIEEVYLLADESRGLEREWTVLVQNHVSIQREGVLVAELFDAAGEFLERKEIPLEVGAGAAVQPRAGFTLPGSGGYRVEFRLPHERGEYFRDRLPSRVSTQFAVVPTGAVMLQIAPGTMRIDKSSSRSGSPILQFLIYNPASESLSGRIDGNVVSADGGVLHRFEQNVALVAPNSSTLFTAGIPMEGALTEPVTFQLRIEPLSGVDAEEEQSWQYSWTLEPGALPDLAVVADSIEVSPQPLSDGLTVFVDAVIENRGSGMARESKAALFLAADEKNAEPLRNITDNDYMDVPALKPGEQIPIRLRWDPVDNAGEYEIKVLADALEGLLEPDKSNNAATIPLYVRTKSKLKPGDLRVVQGDRKGELVLLAKVSNLGETAAQRVTVNFYKSEDQTSENKIAEVPIDWLPPGESVEAGYRWEIDLEQEDLTKLKPTFTVALKGSQMRVSSVAEDGEP